MRRGGNSGERIGKAMIDIAMMRLVGAHDQHHIAYLRVLQQLLPPRAAITRAPGACVTALLSAFAVILADVDASIAGLYDEADPRTTSQLLPDWEAMADLPDPAVNGA